MRTILFLLVAYLLLLPSCSAQTLNQNEQQDVMNTVEGYTINDSQVDMSTAVYSINDFYIFYDDATADYGQVLYLDDINKAFPITYLRKIQATESYYLVYPVIEGGKFLIFLNIAIDFNTGTQKLVSSETLYVDNLPSKSELNIAAGTEFEKIQDMIPCTVLRTTRSASVESYSCLAEGWALICTYERNETGKLYLLEYAFASYEDPNYPFAGVLLSDLT